MFVALDLFRLTQHQVFWFLFFSLLQKAVRIQLMRLVTGELSAMLDLRRKGSKKKGNTEEEGLLREGK